MKVRCNFCEHERSGFCTKKLQRSKPIRIEVNKPRSCDAYSESAGKVVEDFRKKEAHKKKLTEMKKRNVLIADLMRKAKEGRLVAPDESIPSTGGNSDDSL
jgi:hypothetical protein